MQLNTISLIAVAVASAALGVVVYTRAPSRPSNRLWAVHAGLVSCWAVCTFLIEVTDSERAVTIYLQLAHLVSALVLVTFIDFCWVFPEGVRLMPRRPRSLLYLTSLVVGAISALPALVQRVEITPDGLEVKFGWPLAVLGVYALALIIHSDVVIWRKSKVLHGVARVQTMYMLAGAIGFQAMVLGINVFLPMLTGKTDYSRWGVVTYFFTIVTITVAMAKHSLWDLTTAGRRGAAALLTAAVMAAVAVPSIALLALGARPLFMGSPAAMAAFWSLFGSALGVGSVPLYQYFRGLLVQGITEERERIGKLLGALAAAIVDPPPGGHTLMPILAATDEFFAPRTKGAYLRQADGRYIRVGEIDRQGAPLDLEGSPRPEQIDSETADLLGLAALRAPLSSGDLLRFGNSVQASKMLEALEGMAASVVLPISWMGNPLGIIVLGPKVSRDLYSRPELDLLMNVGAQAAIGIRNAELRAEIVAEKERTEKIIIEMGSGVVAVDADHRIAVVNPAALDILQMGEADLVGASDFVLPTALRTCLVRALDEGIAIRGQNLHLRHQPPVRVALSTFVLRGAGGAREGAGVVFRDLRTEDALRRTEEEADRLRFLRVITAGMAHEIRNPLVAIRTFAELAPTRLDDPEFRDSFLQVAKSEVGRLEQLVEQFMTLAKPARNISRPVDVVELIDNAVSAASAGAESKGVSITSRIDEPLPDVHGDETRLAQCLANLLLNALDATEAGGRVEVRAGAVGARDQSGSQFAVSVWNSGSYVPPDERSRLFEPFFTTKVDGTGLGLAICHTIAEEHEGQISVESDEDAGTTFSLTLPAASKTETQKVANP